VKVPAGEYKNVAKVGVKETYIDPETRKEKIVQISIAYYAPNIGLVRTDALLEEDRRFIVFSELVAFTPSVP